MLSWYFFIFIVNQGGTSLLDSEYLIKKIYFPRLILPLTKVVVGLVEFGISVVLLLVIMLISGHPPTKFIIYFPIFLILTMISGLS
ncbi:MAG: ABC transporter permease, partial [Fidelibacterota bacterium]